MSIANSCAAQQIPISFLSGGTEDHSECTMRFTASEYPGLFFLLKRETFWSIMEQSAAGGPVRLRRESI